MFIIKRLIKKSSHGDLNRLEAILYINDQVFIGNQHSDCINQYFQNNDIKNGVGSRNVLKEKIDQDDKVAFGHVVTYDVAINFLNKNLKRKLGSISLDENQIKQLLQDFAQSETRIYIETNSIQNANISEVKSAIMNNTNYSNITFWNDDSFWEETIEVYDEYGDDWLFSTNHYDSL